MIALIVVGRGPTKAEMAEARFVVEIHDEKHLTVWKDNWPGAVEVRSQIGDGVRIGGGPVDD